MDSAANAGVLAILRANTPGAPLESPVEGADLWQLGTHPDLVEQLWTKLGGSLPHACARVAYAQPVLAHPSTGKIFAFAGGTGTLAMRLPSKLLGAARKVEGFGETLRYPSGVLHARELGLAWAFVEPFGEDALSWCLGAYDSAQA